MNIYWLTMRDLQYVIAVAKHQHFGRAAQECNVSQPTLSTQIKKIEGFLNVRLFERTNRRVTVTLAGKNVAEQAQVVLNEVSKIGVMLGKASSVKFETLKLGVITSLSAFIPFILKELKKTFPKSILTLREATTENLLRELKSGGLDAVIVADTVKDQRLIKMPLFFEPFVLAAPKGHGILLRSKLKLSDLKASDMILLDEGHCLREQALGFCPVNRRANRREFHATSIDTLCNLVASGAGYTLLPALAAKNSHLGSLVSFVKFDDERVGRKIVMLSQCHSSELQTFRQLAQTLIRAYPAPRDTKRW
jgi:LysR family hydrogen peroxide-inducible transcriptional activator